MLCFDYLEIFPFNDLPFRHYFFSSPLKRWYFWATYSRLDAAINCAKTIKQHWNGVTNYIKTKISYGILEGTNGLIQAAKDSARGFRSTKNFIITIEFNLPT